MYASGVGKFVLFPIQPHKPSFVFYVRISCFITVEIRNCLIDIRKLFSGAFCTAVLTGFLMWSKYVCLWRKNQPSHKLLTSYAS